MTPAGQQPVIDTTRYHSSMSTRMATTFLCNVWEIGVNGTKRIILTIIHNILRGFFIPDTESHTISHHTTAHIRLVNNGLELLTEINQKVSSVAEVLSGFDEFLGQITAYVLAFHDVLHLGISETNASLDSIHGNGEVRCRRGSPDSLTKVIARIRDTFAEFFPVFDQVLPVGDEAIPCTAGHDKFVAAVSSQCDPGIRVVELAFARAGEMENLWQVHHGVLVILLADAGDCLYGDLGQLNVRSVERRDWLVIFVDVADGRHVLDDVFEGNFIWQPVTRGESSAIAL